MLIPYRPINHHYTDYLLYQPQIVLWCWYFLVCRRHGYWKYWWEPYFYSAQYRMSTTDDVFFVTFQSEHLRPKMGRVEYYIVKYYGLCKEKVSCKTCILLSILYLLLAVDGKNIWYFLSGTFFIARGRYPKKSSNERIQLRLPSQHQKRLSFYNMAQLTSAG